MTPVLLNGVEYTPEIVGALDRGAALVVSISGGKDSQAMAKVLASAHAAHGWSGPIELVHADLGRIEWPQTAGHVERIASDLGLPLTVVRRLDGKGEWDMIARWRMRAETLLAQGKQARPWSDANNRFCTAEMKRGPIDKLLRHYPLVISAEGLRADESRARATKSIAEPRRQITTRGREAWTWRPILHWTEADVWQTLGDWPAHPAYALGNRRLSCAFCVLGCKSDLANAARQLPELHAELVAMEKQYGFTFQPGRSLEVFG